MPVLKIFGPDCEEALSIPCQANQKLSKAIWLGNALLPAPLCGGLGTCGNCRCRFLHSPPPPCQAEERFFTPEELTAGWRLACRHLVPDKTLIELQLPARTFQPAIAARCDPKANSRPVTLGIDLGTTSIQWQAQDETGSITGTGTVPNPQSGAGADVISRLQFAANKADKALLANLVLQACGRQLCELARQGYQPKRICMAGNSAMTEILLQKDISGLAAAPYALSFTGNSWLPIVYPPYAGPVQTYFPPLAGPFIGGDITAGLMALQDAPRPFILADLGTNAEMALLGQQGQLFLASAPLGPALEGIGPINGQPAGPGVITKFSLSASGLEASALPGAAQPPGISASGYLSLLALLLNLNILSSDGQFQANQTMPLAARICARLADNGLGLPHGFVLTPQDVELLLKVKAAFAVALQRLLKFAHMEIGEIDSIYLAGALGEYFSLHDLQTTGFLTPAMAAKAQPCGNTALKGACLLARSPELGEELAKICAHAQILQLADAPDFLEDYMEAMRWGA